MSLEQGIAELVSALKENNELLRGLTAKAKAGTVAADKADDKVKKDDDAPKGRGRPRKDDGAKEKPISAAKLTELAKGYLDVESDAEYEERKALLKAIAKHFDVETLKEADDAERIVIAKLIETAKAGENVDADDIEGAIESLDEEKPAKRRRSDDV